MYKETETERKKERKKNAELPLFSFPVECKGGVSGGAVEGNSAPCPAPWKFKFIGWQGAGTGAQRRSSAQELSAGQYAATR